MTPEEAEHQCFIVTVGSQDTSAAFISAFMYYVTRDDRVYEKLWEEIQSFQEKGLLSHPVVSFDETCQLKYFMACVREALRISPSVSMPLPRFAPPGGIMLGSTWIPEGVELAANPYVIHRDAEVYGEDADEFRPERWFEDPARVHLMNKYFLAFGYGSRKCLGRNIALFESQKFCLQVGFTPGVPTRLCRLTTFLASSRFSSPHQRPQEPIQNGELGHKRFLEAIHVFDA